VEKQIDIFKKGGEKITHVKEKAALKFYRIGQKEKIQETGNTTEQTAFILSSQSLGDTNKQCEHRKKCNSEMWIQKQ